MINDEYCEVPLMCGPLFMKVTTEDILVSVVIARYLSTLREHRHYITTYSLHLGLGHCSV